MAQWVKSNQLGTAFLAALVVGLTLVSAGLFTVSATVGLIGTGCLVLASAHWITYLAKAARA